MACLVQRNGSQNFFFGNIFQSFMQILKIVLSLSAYLHNEYYIGSIMKDPFAYLHNYDNWMRSHSKTESTQHSFPSLPHQMQRMQLICLNITHHTLSKFVCLLELYKDDSWTRSQQDMFNLKSLCNLSSLIFFLVSYVKVLCLINYASHNRPGVAAGKAAGMEVVAVPYLPKQSHLYVSADEVINSLLDFRPEKWGLPPFQDCKNS